MTDRASKTLSPSKSPQSPKWAAAVIVFPGSNGDRDLLETFAQAGFDAFAHPAETPLPARSPQGIPVGVAGLPGGFAYGDYWRAGMLACQAQAVQSLQGFVQRGGLVVGVCNGFQILVEAGLLPGALSYNAPPGFRHRWLKVKVSQETSSLPWFGDLTPGQILHIPMAHGEGNYIHPDGEDALRPHVPLQYLDNPNGSLLDAAAVCDPTGRILGVMPHPERAADADLGSADGLAIFTSARSWLETHPLQALETTESPS